MRPDALNANPKDSLPIISYFVLERYCAHPVSFHTLTMRAPLEGSYWGLGKTIATTPKSCAAAASQSDVSEKQQSRIRLTHGSSIDSGC